MWLLTLIIGLVIGWFARTLVDLIRQVAQKIKGIEEALETKEHDEPGIVRPGIIQRPTGITKLKPVDDGESSIVRSPSPRQVALEEEANRNRVRTL